MPSAARTRRFPWIRTLLVVLLSCLTTWVVACVMSAHRGPDDYYSIVDPQDDLNQDYVLLETYTHAHATMPNALRYSITLDPRRKTSSDRLSEGGSARASWIPDARHSERVNPVSFGWTRIGWPFPAFLLTKWQFQDSTYRWTLQPQPAPLYPEAVTRRWDSRGVYGRDGQFSTAWEYTWTDDWDPLSDYFGWYTGDIKLLYRPIPLGFTLNSLVAAPLWIAVLFGPGWTRRFTRKLRRRCTACGYDIEQLATCPECGTARR